MVARQTSPSQAAPQTIVVLDTNVLIHDPEAPLQYRHGTEVHILIHVLEQLDKASKQDGLVGYNAQQAARILSTLSDRGNIKEGVKTDRGGVVKIAQDGHTKTLPNGFKRDESNAILAHAKYLTEQERKRGRRTKVIFITKEAIARVKACALGVQCEDYGEEAQMLDFPELQERLALQVVSVPLETITELHNNHDGILVPDGVRLHPNQGCILTAENNRGEMKTALALYKSDDPRLVYVKKPQASAQRTATITPRNNEQAIAYHLLRDPSLDVVFLLGPPGSGKTLLALDAGIELLDKKKSDALRIFRSTQESSDTLGFLPGDLDEKMEPWKKAINELVCQITHDDQINPGHEEKNFAHQKSKNKTNEFFEQDIITVECINFLLGQTHTNIIALYDEAQNFTRRQTALCLSRSGEGTRAFVVGDLNQIYTPYLDPRTSGMNYWCQKLLPSGYVGVSILTESVRSRLSQLVALLGM